MKTAISIPDELFEAADAAAQEAGVSRSELYRRAIREYLNNYAGAAITSRINEVCAQVDTRLDPELAAATDEILAQADW